MAPVAARTAPAAGAGTPAQAPPGQTPPGHAVAPRAPDFKMSASPDNLVVRRGASGQITVKIEPVSGFTGRVDLLTSLLYATTITLQPRVIENGSGSAVLTISPSAETIKGTYTLSITGTNEGTARSITVMVKVK